MKFHLYSSNVFANVKLAMQCYEIFGGNGPNVPLPGYAPSTRDHCAAFQK